MNLQFGHSEGPTSADLLLDPEKHVVARPLVVPNADPEVMVEGKLLDRSRAQKINRRATARTPPTSGELSRR